MSLINEALKRTRDAAYQPVHTPSLPAPDRGMQDNVEPGRSNKKLAAVTVIAALAVGVMILLAWRLSARVETASPREDSTAATAKQLPAIAPITSPTEAPAKASENQIVAKVMEKIKAEQPAASTPAPGEPPKLVLQGITYASDSRDAMINGLTVHEGEDIEGARVVTIESRRVKLDFSGREITLRLP